MFAPGERKLRRGVVVYTTGLFLLLMTLATPILWDAPFTDDLVYPLCLILLILTIWALWSWRVITGSLFNPYTLFFLSAALFNGGQAFLEVFGLNRDGLLGGRFSDRLLVQTLLIVILGLTAFHFGALLAAITRKPAAQPRPPLPASSVRAVGWVLLAVSIIPAFALLRDAVALVLQYGYFELYQQDPNIGFNAAPQVLGTFLVPAALFLLAGSERKPRLILVSLIVVMFYVVVNLFMGRRAQAIPTIIVYAWLWHRTVRPLPKTILIAAAVVVLAFVIPLTATIRNIPGEERLTLDYIISIYASLENPTLAAVAEMGGSMSILTYTIQLVPFTHPYEYGQSYVYSLLTAFPNFFWDVHPTIAHGLAGDWLIWTIDPYTAARGGGLGYSFIAETYLNFGWVGALIVMVVMGFAYAAFVCWADQKERYARMATIASFLVFFLFFARSETAAIVRPLVWYSLLPFLMTLIVSRLFRRQNDTMKTVDRPSTVPTP